MSTDLSNLDRERLRARILANVKVTPCGCWLWKLRANNGGYGVMSVWLDGYSYAVKLYVHRVAYFAWKRRPPKGKPIAHSYRCLSQLCCNPEHLRATTQSANERDKKRARAWRLLHLREVHPPVHLVAEA